MKTYLKRSHHIGKEMTAAMNGHKLNEITITIKNNINLQLQNKLQYFVFCSFSFSSIFFKAIQILSTSIGK